MISEAKDKVNTLLEEAEEILDNAKKKAGNYVEDGKNTIEKKGIS
jgi:F0F1-type ATP synthase membrane subunit b/b'